MAPTNVLSKYYTSDQKEQSIKGKNDSNVGSQYIWVSPPSPDSSHPPTHQAGTESVESWEEILNKGKVTKLKFDPERLSILSVTFVYSIAKRLLSPV